LLRNKPLARKMGEKGRETVKSLEATRQIDQLERVLTSVHPGFPVRDFMLSQPFTSICV